MYNVKETLNYQYYKKILNSVFPKICILPKAFVESLDQVSYVKNTTFLFLSINRKKFFVFLLELEYILGWAESL